jgi:hypothetical protein
LDFENALLLKHNINSLMPFPCSFSLDFKNALLPKCGHQFTNALSMFFFIGYLFNEKATSVDGWKKKSFIFIH